MLMTIDDYILKSPLMFHIGGRALDYEKMVNASDSDFAQLYRELMKEYRDTDGWWNAGNNPKCDECLKVIPDPRQLRRYNGRSMHPSCFKRFYAKEGDDKGIMRRYWKRVADVVLD